MNTNDWGDVLAHQALQWNGKSFAPGVKEQCMNWVRKVLEQAQHPYAARVTAAPVDKHWTGPSLASSLAGRDLGAMIVKIEDLEKGDIVTFNDTYYVGREFGRGTITHVGIALGPTSFIHRNTMSAPVNVQPFAGMWKSNFRAGLRVPQTIKADSTVKAPIEAATCKLYLNANGSSLTLRQELDPGSYTLWSSGSTSDGSWLGKLVPRGGVSPSPGVSRLWLGNGSTLDLGDVLKPGSYSLVSAGSAGGAWLLKLVPR